MLNKIAKYNHNWILVLAMSLAVLFILMALLLEIKTPISRVNAFDGIPILVLLAFGSVIAPILEELSFRGFFTENRKLKLIALIGFLSYTTMSFCSKYSIVVAVVNGLVFLLAIALFRQFKSNAFCVLFVVYNAFVFGLIHYTAEDFANGSYPFVLVQTILGLLFTWITINSRLTVAMIFHGVWNSLAFISLFISLQFVSKEMKIIENEAVKISYQQLPVLDSKSTSVTNETNVIIGKNTTIKTFLDFATIHPDLKKKYSSVVPMARYNITVEFKGGKANHEEVLTMLQEQKLVIKN